MATLAIVLNTTKKLSSDEYSVALRVTQNRIRKYYAISNLITDQTLNFKCKPSNWKPAAPEDNGLGRFLPSVKDFKLLNQKLAEKLSLAQQILNSDDYNNIPFDFGEFEIELKGNRTQAVQSKSTSVQEYYDSIILELDKQHKVGLAAVFTFTKSSLKEYNPLVTLADINVRFLEAFESWLRNTKKLKDTSISVKIRNIQRLVNLAIADKLFKQDDYPFGEKKYSVNKRLNHATRKRSVSSDIITKVKQYKAKPGSSMHLAQNIFMFSYYTRGMNFIDIADLKWTDIYQDEIHYVRKKTRQFFTITVNSYSRAILDFYKENNTNSGNYVFPIYNDAVHVTAKQRYERKKSALKLVNLRLREIAVAIGEPSLNLTTYVSRHSYATNLKRTGAAKVKGTNAEARQINS